MVDPQDDQNTRIARSMTLLPDSEVSRMDRSTTTGLANSRPHSRPLGRVAAFMAASIVTLLIAGAPSAAAGSVISKGLVDAPTWSAKESVQFVPAPPAASHVEALQPAFTPGASEVTGEELEYHKEAESKGVEHTPKVYVIFWGKNFETLTSGKETQAKLETLFKGLENSSYQGILTQYFDTKSHVSAKVTVSLISDTSVAAPANVGTRAIRVEAEKYRAKNESTENLENAQFMVVAAPGSTYEAGFEPAGEGFCAYHNLDNTGYAYSFVPYEGDKPFPEKGCLESDGSESAVHETSRFASAAYADTVTDPHMNAWKTKAGHEIDYGEVTTPCAKELDLELPGGAWAQNLYDDHLLGCKHTDLSPPLVYAISQPATGVNPTEGTLTAVVNPENLTTKYHIQWGLTNAYGNNTPVETLNPSIENSSVTATIAKLGSETTYHYRITAENSTGTTYGYDGTFTTLKAEPPYALTEPASNLEETAATLNGTINPKQLPTKYFFEWGETESYTNKTTENTASGSSNVPDHETVTGLQPLHEYHYRIKAESAGGLESGLDKAFVTPGWFEQEGPATGSERWWEYGGRAVCAEAHFCISVFHTKTEVWRGSGWSEVPSTFGGYKEVVMESVSCWQAEGCMAVGQAEMGHPPGVSFAATWNGNGWTLQHAFTELPPAYSGQLQPVSCRAANACIVIGLEPWAGSSRLMSEVWNGSSWSHYGGIGNEEGYPVGGEGAIGSVSCGAPTRCAFVARKEAVRGRDEQLFTWNGSYWTRATELPESLAGVSCDLAGECVVVEEGGVAYRSLSPGAPFVRETMSGSSSAISCISATFCEAMGSVFQRWNGKTWQQQQLAPGTYGSEAGGCWSERECFDFGVWEGKERLLLRGYGPPVPTNTVLPQATPTTPEQEVTETVSTGTWLHEPLSAYYKYQWELCNATGGECATIGGATSEKYTPTGSTIGHTLRAKVMARNSVGSNSAFSPVTNTVKAAGPPTNTQLPVISPATPEQGSPASASTGKWTHEPTSYTYQWELCNATGGECASITGATSSKYTPTEANVGHTLRVTVTAKNGEGSAAVTSNATNPIVRAVQHFTQTIDSPNSIRAVSCIPSTTDCVVTDSTGKALYATNVSSSKEATWKTWAGPSGASPSQAVDCLSTSLCLIADGKETAGGSLYYAKSLGGSFTEAYTPSYGVDAVSCVSAALCVSAQDGLGYYRYATSPASTGWTLEEQGTAAMKAVACLSTSTCAIADSQGKIHIATTTSQIESAKWTETDIDGTTALNGVACTSTTSCIAVDGAGYVLNLTVESSGAVKVTTNHLDGTNALTAVTCSSTTCITVDNTGNVFESTNSGTTWKKTYALIDDLTSVSCASTALCVTVDTTGHVTTFLPE